MRILVVRPDAIGDVVLMVPLINTLKSAYPDSEIYTLQQPYTIPILENHSGITAVIPDWKKMRRIRGVHGFMACARYIKTFGFDMAFFPYLEPYYVSLAAVAGIPIRVGDANKIGLRPLLTHTVPINFRNLLLHETEQSAKLIWAVKPNACLKLRMELPVTLDERAAGSALLQSAGWGGGRYVVVHPRSGGGNRPWLPSKYAELIDLLNSEGLVPVLTGSGTGELQVIADIRNLAKTTFIDLGGKTQLRELMAIIAGAEVVVGTDTGPTHIAAALQRPVVTISPTKFVKALRWGPWQTQNTIVSESQACHLTCQPYRCKKSICLEAVSAQRVLQAIGVMAKSSTIQPVSTKEQWIKTSIHSIVYWSGRHDAMPSVVETYAALRRHGYVANLVVRSWRFRRMLVEWAGIPIDDIQVIPPFDWVSMVRFINTRDASAIFIHGPVVKWYWWLIRQLSALRQYCPPVIIPNCDPIVTESDIALTLVSQMFI